MCSNRFNRTYFGYALSNRHVPQNHFTTDVTKLQSYNLPIVHDERALADWLGIPLGRLRWLTHDQLDDSIWHYLRYSIPKRNGGVRVILAPKKELKQLQRFILSRLLYRVQPKILSDAAHGFVPNRSIVTNARNHIHKHTVLRMDLEGFFPSIEVTRVRDLFTWFGYSTPVASTLALLCTERDRIEIITEGVTHYCSNGPRHLVQGAPTSPALANLIAHELDVRMELLAGSYDLVYTRYADDLIFSGQCARIPQRFLSATHAIIQEQGFQVNHKKTSFVHCGSRQMVTGIVVNDETSTPRVLRRKLRAILHNAEVDGFTTQNRDERPNFEGYIQGMIAFVESANPSQALPLREAFNRARFASQSSRWNSTDPLPERNSKADTTPPVKAEPELTKSDLHYIPVAGDHVVHPKYGRGVVTEIRASGDITVAEVQFSHSKVGMKSLEMSLARLKPAAHKA